MSNRPLTFRPTNRVMQLAQKLAKTNDISVSEAMNFAAERFVEQYPNLQSMRDALKEYRIRLIQEGAA